MKNGSGTLDLGDGNAQSTVLTNTFTGGLTINGGLVTVNGERNLGAVPGTNTATSINFNGGELRMTRTFAIDSHRGITVGPQGGTISYNGGNTTTIGSSAVTGSGDYLFMYPESWNCRWHQSMCN